MGIFAITIAVLFIILSAYIIFADAFEYIPFNYRVIFGGLLFIYGFFRLISIYYKVNTGNKLIDDEQE